MADKRSPHILNTSANLLGLCFIVLTSIKVAKMGDVSIIDETTAIAIVLFMSSCIFSFLAMRKDAESTNNHLEKLADILFLSGLIVLFLTTMIITFNIIK
jgi:fumarate reductase subunit C